MTPPQFPKSPDTYPIDAAGLSLLKENAEVFSFLGDLQRENSLPDEINIQARDTRVLAPAPSLSCGESEEKQVTIIYRIDDNKSAEDGYIELSDHFGFDSTEQYLNRFQRDISWFGEEVKWRSYSQIIENRAGDLLSKNPELLGKYAFSLGKAYPRFLHDSSGRLSEDIKNVFSKHQIWLADTVGKINSVNPAWSIRLGSPQNYYMIASARDGIQLTLSLAVDDDTNPGNGRILLHNHFGIGPIDQSLKTFAQSWELAPETKAAGILHKTELAALRAETNTSLNRPELFVRDFLEAAHPSLPKYSDISDIRNIYSLSSWLNMEGLDDAIRADLHYLRGMAHLQMNELDKAVQDFSLSVQLDSNHEAAFHGLGVALFYLGEYSSALDSFSKTVEINPERALDFHYGATQYHLGDLEGAQSTFKQILWTYPDDPYSLYFLGLAQLDSGRNVDAIQALNRFIETAAEVQNISFYYLGLAYMRLGDKRSAFRNFTAAIEAGSEDARIYYHRGMVSAHGLSDFDRSLQLEPNFVPAYVKRGLIHYENGSYQLALDDFINAQGLDASLTDEFLRPLAFCLVELEIQNSKPFLDEVLRKNPEDVEARYYRGLVNYRTGHFSEAAADFEAVLARDKWHLRARYYLLLGR